jgi:hypothetical protein
MSSATLKPLLKSTLTVSPLGPKLSMPARRWCELLGFTMGTTMASSRQFRTRLVCSMSWHYEGATDIDTLRSALSPSLHVHPAAQVTGSSRCHLSYGFYRYDFVVATAAEIGVRLILPLVSNCAFTTRVASTDGLIPQRIMVLMQLCPFPQGKPAGI